MKISKINKSKVINKLIENKDFFKKLSNIYKLINYDLYFLFNDSYYNYSCDEIRNIQKVIDFLYRKIYVINTLSINIEYNKNILVYMNINITNLEIQIINYNEKFNKYFKKKYTLFKCNDYKEFDKIFNDFKLCLLNINK